MSSCTQAARDAREKALNAQQKMQVRITQILAELPTADPPTTANLQNELNAINLALPCIPPLVATLDQVIYYSAGNP